MLTITKKIVLSALVILLTACAHYPHQYSSYPSNETYYSGSSYGNYQYNYPRQPAPGYWGGRSLPYPGNHSNNYYYENNNYYNRQNYQNYPAPGYGYQGNRPYYQHRDYGDRHADHGGWSGHNDQHKREQPVTDQHENRNFNPERNNGQQNWGGRHDQNSQPRARQPMASPGERRYSETNRAGQGNGNQRGDNDNRQQNRGGWQNQKNQPQPRAQFNQGQNEARNPKFEATYDRIQQRIMQSSGQNGNGQNHKKRKQNND